MNLKYLPIGDESPRIINAVVELPKGSRNKYEYNMELGVFQLDRVLYSSMHYPEAYGFIPSTLYDDGDPMDVLIVIDQPLQTGIMIEVRPIGILKMQDEKGTDDKIISVAKGDPTYSTIRSVKDLPRHTLIEIEHFFTSYKELEGKHVKSFGWHGVTEARRAVMRASRAFAKTVQLQYRDGEPGR
ncbi:MAG TPA: inorganic diphosphatase [Bacteroidota bacterium]|nr:inorganic diphosphatase [Bacteroidota bacterium]